MINLPDVDPIVVALRSEPFDPDNTFFEIHGDHQSILVASYVEHDVIAGNDTRRRVGLFDIGRTRPFRLPHFVKLAAGRAVGVR
jgi:hypothetical protein